MSRRCHLCGREGTRGYLEATAAVISTGTPRVWWDGLTASFTITICAARRACNHRRGVS